MADLIDKIDHPDVHGRVVNKGNRNSIEYWNNRADSLQNLRRGRSWEISDLSDEDLELGYQAYDPSQQKKKGYTWLTGSYTYTPGEVLQKQGQFAKRMRALGYRSFPADEVIKEYNYRKAIRDAKDDNVKAQINNDYVRKEWQDYHQAMRDKIEKNGGSWEDWLQATYGTHIDPANTFRIQQQKPTNPFHLIDFTNLDSSKIFDKIANDTKKQRDKNK